MDSAAAPIIRVSARDSPSPPRPDVRTAAGNNGSVRSPAAHRASNGEESYYKSFLESQHTIEEYRKDMHQLEAQLNAESSRYDDVAMQLQSKVLECSKLHRQLSEAEYKVTRLEQKLKDAHDGDTMSVKSMYVGSSGHGSSDAKLQAQVAKYENLWREELLHRRAIELDTRELRTAFELMPVLEKQFEDAKRLLKEEKTKRKSLEKLFRTRVAEMEEQMRSRTMEATETARANAAAALGDCKRCAEKDSQLQQLTHMADAKMTEWQLQYSFLQERLDKATAEAQRATALAAQVAALESAARDAKESSEKKISIAEAKSARAEQLLEQAKQMITESHTKFAILESRSRQSAAPAETVEQVESDIRGLRQLLEAQKATAQAQAQSYESAIQDLHTRLADQEQETGRLRQKLKEAEGRYRQLEDEFLESSAELDKLQIEAKSSKERVHELEAAVRSGRTDDIALPPPTSEQAAEMASLQAKVAALEAAAKDKNASVAVLTSRVAELEAALKTLEETSGRKIQEAERKRSRAEDLLGQAQQLVTESHSKLVALEARSTASNAPETIRNLQQMLDSKNVEIQSMQGSLARLAEVEQEVLWLRQELAREEASSSAGKEEAWRAGLAQAKAQGGDMAQRDHKEIAYLRQELAAKDEALHALQARAQGGEQSQRDREEIAYLRGELAAREKELHALQREQHKPSKSPSMDHQLALESREQEIKVLKQEVVQLKKKVDELEQSYRELEDDFLQTSSDLDDVTAERDRLQELLDSKT